ncbi:MAG: tRNA-dihydrouridine synthase, partial [Desulfobacteraceae bacterium]
TIKIRSGWDNSGRQALEMAHIAQQCGVDAITVHPRTARQGFGGQADWNLIGRIKKEVDFPVIGNGDILTAHDALRMFSQTGCDAVMVGRAAIGNPMLFAQIIDLLEEKPARTICPKDRISMMIRYIKTSVHYLGEKKACFILRSRLGWFVKGLPEASSFRKSIRHLESEAQTLDLTHAYAEKIT